MQTNSLLQSWGGTLTESFMRVWSGVIGFIPQLVLAIIIFLAGWVVGSLLGNVVSRVVKSLKIDEILSQVGIGALCEKAGWRLDSGKFLGALVEIFVVVGFLIATLDILGLNAVTQFITLAVVPYLGNVIVAVLMLLVGSVVAHVMHRVVTGATRAANINSSNFLGNVTKWAIWVFSILIAINHLGLDGPYLQTLFTGVVVALSVAAGLAFGLGGQDAASQVIERVRREINSHHQG